MYFTSISLSYVFLGIAFIALCFSIYFALLLSKVRSSSINKKKVLGNMKDPQTWQFRNRNMLYASLFWTLLSLALFIVMKFFRNAALLSSAYLFVYIGIIALSVLFVGLLKRGNQKEH